MSVKPTGIVTGGVEVYHDESGDVSPGLPAHDAIDQRNGNAIFSRQLRAVGFARCVTPADDSHIILAQLRQGVLGTSQAAPLAVHIVGVVLSRTQKEVCRIDTATVIAGVQDHRLIGDRAMRQFPGEAVRLYVGAALAAQTESPIPTAAQPGLPFPAPIRFCGTVHLRPESYLWFLGVGRKRANSRAVLSPAFRNAGRRLREWLAAIGATALHAWGILAGHNLNLLHRLGECHAPGESQSRAGALCCPNYTIGRP